MSELRPLLVMGTRPEAIKMAPIVHECRRTPGIEPIVCFTGQHDTMLRQVTDYFEIEPDVDLKLMTPGQSLTQLTSRCLTELEATIQHFRPTCVVAQGDTTSVLAASLAAFYRRLPFVHVEAGLRTGDLTAPWPEEMNRRVASVVTTLHCAPTRRAAEQLRREGVAEDDLRVTGNTVIDALLWTTEREQERSHYWRDRHEYLNGQPMVLITAHRRENHAALAEIFQSLAALARRHRNVSFVFPVHLNPQVQSAARSALEGIPNVRLLEPLPYPEFVWMMNRSTLIVSDSGGVQEEAPSLRRPVIALRESTERQEAVEIGAVQLVGSSAERLEAAVSRLLGDPAAYASMQTTHNPFGDGRAAERIVAWMVERLAPVAQGVSA